MSEAPPAFRLPEPFVDGVRSVLGRDALLLSDEELRPYECDALSVHRRRPAAVCLPATVDEARRVLSLCREYGVPIVPRGAGTGLSGGALPVDEGIVLSLARLTRILEIDPDNRTARVEPGVRNLAISDAVADMGLFYAPDPSSQIACTIAGNVAENSGGVHCLKYGLTLHNVLGLVVLTVDGERIEVGRGLLDDPGIDLLPLFCGSEGLLGLVVEITVRLLPRPESVALLMATFDDARTAASAVAEIIASGIVPAGLEMMDRLAIEAAEAFCGIGYPTGAAALLLCELDGMAAEVDEQVETVRRLFAEAGSTAISIAREAAERDRLWAGRKAAFPAVGRMAPDYYCMDGTIPRHRLPEVLERIGAWSREYGLPVANVFHAGDGNLHPLILYDANRPGELERTEAFGQRILELCVAVGGSVTGEHGVGIEKLDAMCSQFDDDVLACFHRVKEAFDPGRLLNPGKAVPTLHRCAEFGAMHVHAGRLPFPELDRF